ncbi:LpxI family protein [Arenibacterium sp. CAU 1754]
MLALIAGAGDLPRAIVSATDSPPLICAYDGSGPDDVEVDLTFRLETLGSFLDTLKDRGVETVCFAGAIARPRIDPAAIDAKTLPLVPRFQAALAQGDDGALRVVIDLFQEAGFTVKGAHQIAPDLLPQEGVLGEHEPAEADRADTTRGFDILSALSAADIGQACVVKNRQALALEGVFGTDWMLASLQSRPDASEGGGVLVKAPKTGQDLRIDMPTIGPDTVLAAARADLSGIVIARDGVIVLNRPQVIEECDRLGLFLWVRGPDG